MQSVGVGDYQGNYNKGVFIKLKYATSLMHKFG